MASVAASSLTGASLASAADPPAAPPKVLVHVKYRNVIIGPERGVAITVICISAKGKITDAHLAMSTGDDDIDTAALNLAKSQPFEPLIVNGEALASCREKTIHMEMPPLPTVTVETVKPTP